MMCTQLARQAAEINLQIKMLDKLNIPYRRQFLTWIERCIAFSRLFSLFFFFGDY
jgi:hypothetical protein